MTGVPDFLGWRHGDPSEFLMEKEWLATNGLGGYASASLAGFCTRRYHGVLVANLGPPLGRTQFVPLLEEHLITGGQRIRMTARETRDETLLPDEHWLAEAGVSMGLPVWRYRSGPVELERCVFMPHLRNVTIVRYSLSGAAGEALELELRPFVHMRSHDGRVDDPMRECRLEARGSTLTFTGAGYPPLQIRCIGKEAACRVDAERIEDAIYRVERSRGYDYSGELASPACFRASVAPAHPLILCLSVEEAPEAEDIARMLDEEIDRRQRLVRAADPRLHEGASAQLVLAADQFVVAPPGREGSAAPARVHGTRERRSSIEAGTFPERSDERTIIAGYHWFTDWGRDTMISLEGLCLLTGRMAEADRILRMFGRHVRDGLIPNMFPEGQMQGRYNTADATLWFFHAIDRYLHAGGREETLAHLLPGLRDMIERHLAGTRFGIRVDPSDGLLAQGEPDCQLTWMDAKVDDWVVTPRRGKAVEINALFYNALMLLAGWLGKSDPRAADRCRAHAERVRRSFNARFWNPACGYLYDVVDGDDGRDDASLRPNQVLALALPHPVLAPEHWGPVVDAVSRELLTPVGLRTLAPDHPDYKPFYDGDLRARDAAYHQGTVWPWLMGPFMDAWLKVHGDASKAAKFIAGLYPQLSEGCVGTISEIFDAESPFNPRGCAAQAWSVAELIRVTALLGSDHGPGAP